MSWVCHTDHTLQPRKQHLFFWSITMTQSIIVATTHHVMAQIIRHSKEVQILDCTIGYLFLQLSSRSRIITANVDIGS